MMNRINFSPEAEIQFFDLKNNKAKKAAAKAVVKALIFMNQNLRHPSLNTHEFDDMEGPKGQKVFESYAQNNTPGAYRIFWYYGENKGEIMVLAITQHP